MRLLNPGGLTPDDEWVDELIAALEIDNDLSDVPGQAAPPSPSTVEEPGKLCKSWSFLC